MARLSGSQGVERWKPYSVGGFEVLSVNQGENINLLAIPDMFLKIDPFISVVVGVKSIRIVENYTTPIF